ncbi:SNF2 family N-terminal domain containing protein [Brugia malayi]|uniref:SNF2 family N-terminal domain containing protein n=1 Tax=Brugia malayi TaxID=6279 RepID=A0A4E9F647_BRUMA|nr:SNF2 family N-terminal domain containing protein [Brugia malayi]VIO92229.1 SNF2 family N-terminal domain containing protein [Brugia malayi]
MSSISRPIRRSRRNVNIATTSTMHPDDMISMDSSGGDTSPPTRRRRLNTDDPMEGCSKSEGVSTKRKTDAKIELGVRLIAQMRYIHSNRRNVALERTNIGNESENQINPGIVNSELTFEDGVSLGMSLNSLLGPEAKREDIVTRKQHVRPVLDVPEASLSPIEIKVEENSAASPCSSYLEQQPSTSTITAHPASSIPSATAHSTPRSSSAAGVESSVERVAKQEAQVLARIAELRRQGLWTASRLPMIEMPPRNKTHWDYLLEEMRWMAIDFRQERTFKRQAAKKFSSQIARMLRDREQEKERSEQRAVREAKRICALIAKMVRDFWQNVDRVVDLHAQEIIESMKRKALDQQLEVMVGHADKLSEMVQEGLIGEKSSRASSLRSGDITKDEDAASFSTDSDDISLSDAEAVDGNVEEEMQGLMAEGNLELDDFLDSLPRGYLESISKSRHEEDLFESTQGTSADYKRPEGSEVSTEYTASEITQEEDSTRHSASITQSISSVSEKETLDPTHIENAEKGAISAAINYDRLTSENSEERQKELANIAEEALKFQPKGFTLETTQVKTEVPYLVRGTLREYQMVGLDWLVTLYDNGLNGILADEMGLGKTIQTIALLAHLACKEYIWGPHLIVVPTSVILNWEMEFKKWCPAFKLLTYFGNQKERAEKRKGWSKMNAFHVCITSYKIVTQDIRSFKHKTWQYFILDEAQNIKNFKSQRWQTLLNIRARRRLLLTGTPLQNSLMELWSLMHFLMPAIFASHNDFKDWFSNPLNDMMEGNAEWNASLIQRLHKVLRPFILRRLKSDVEKQLPEKTEHIIHCPLSKRQRCLYDDFMSRRSTRENLRSGSVMSVLNIVMQLRKCCNHPNLFEPRPILSPFVMQPLTITLPGILLNICQGRDLEEIDVLDLFKFSPSCGSLFACSEGRHLAINEQMLNDYLSSPVDIPMPNLGGFHFSRPPPQLHPQPQTREGSKVFMPVPLPSAGIPRGNELYVSVDDLGNARVYQLVVDSTGGHTVRECEPNSVAGNRLLVSNATTSQNTPAARSSTELAAQSTLQTSPKLLSVKQTTVEPTTTSLSTAVPLLKPAFRSTTILSQTRSSSDTCLKGTGTVNNGCTSLPETHIAATFPINRAQQVKLLEPESASVGNTGSAIDTNRVQVEVIEIDQVKPTVAVEQADEKLGLYDFLILPDTSKAVEQAKVESLQRCATICSRRLLFPNVCRTPLVSDELLSVIKKELGRTKHHRYNLSTTDSLGWLTQSLVDWTSDASQRFTVFVHGALADEPVLQINTTGCHAYIRKEWDDLNEECHRMVLNSNRIFSNIDMMQKLQFPELRLIEYDCGKLQVLNSLLHDLFLYKHRCLIFTQMARVLDILQAFLSFHGYQYFRLDGTTGIEQRQAMTERFNADPKIFCFILSTRSGGIGVNLTGADTVIFYDSDWNPTMDAQAQDRCHRIGQTRNVTIYRLVSERTIEENILRKAMQKRRLGEMAIDEAGFTPEFFKGDNVRDLFEGVANVTDVVVPVAVIDNKEIEKAMAKVEDIQDVHAAQRANAEVEADIAEFDENGLIASVENNQEKIESKYLELINQLKPIERYAVNFLEAEYKPEFEEEVKEAKAMIDSKKDEWMKAQEDAMEEDNGDNQSDDEISLTYLTGSDVPGSVDEVICLDIPGEEMLTWLPPSPPPSDSGDDIYYDSTGEYWFEQLPMAECRLPTTIHELHRPRPLTPTSSLVPEQFVPEIIVPSSATYQVTPGSMSTNVAIPPIVALPPSPTGMCTVASGIVRDIVSSPTASLSSISHERGINLMPQTGVSSGAAYLDTSNLLRPTTPSCLPGSVDDAIDSVRKSAQKALSAQGTQRSQPGSGRPSLLDSRSGKTELRRPFTPPPRYREAIDYDGTEWSIAEDYEALMVLTELQRLPNHLHSSKIGQYANWDMVSVLLGTSSEIYRSPRQCSLHYQMVVQPREEGRMVTLDPITKKTRRVPLSTGEMIHMKRGRTKTDQQYLADILKLMSNQYDKKAKALRAASLKQTVLFYPKTTDDDMEKWCPTQSQELKFAELGIRYDATTTCSEVVDYRNERREKLREQDRERSRLKEEEEQKKEAMVIEQQRSHEQKLIRKESAVTAIPGIIHYQKVSYGAVMEHAQQQLSAASAPVMTTPAVSTVRTYTSGSCVQGQLVSNISGQSTTYAGDAPQVIVSQRTYVDHPQVFPKFQAVSGAAPGAHQISTRRVAISVGSGTSTQHQIIMTGGAQMGSSGGQQPYAVVVNSQDTLSGQQLGSRFQYTTRQEGVAERQTIYRTIPSTGTKKGLSAPTAQRIATGYGTSPEAQQQIYATTSHAGRTLIMSQGDGSQLSETGQIQMIRPQIQTGGMSVRQDARTKINQRTPGRLYVTTAAGDRTYLMPQSQVRMMPSGQRITQKRTAGAIHAKTIGGQPQVAMMLPRGSPVQQIRTIPRNIGYQNSRVPSIGLVMSGSSRNSENVTASATTKQLSSAGGISRQTISSAPSNTRQVTVAVQGISNSTPTMLQDHSASIPAQQTQYLPPITLSNQASVQQRYVTSQPPSGSGGTPSVANTTSGMQPSHTDIS